MNPAALTSADNYFEDFEAGMLVRHARGKTVTEMDNVLITNLVMNTAEGHFNEDAMRRDGRGIFHRDTLAIGRQAAGGGQTCNVEGVLDRDRKPFERAGCAIGDAFVRGFRHGAGRVAILRDDSVEARVQHVDASEGRFQQLGGVETVGQ